LRVRPLISTSSSRGRLAQFYTTIAVKADARKKTVLIYLRDQRALVDRIIKFQRVQSITKIARSHDEGGGSYLNRSDAWVVGV
jgi:hypothetical protein